MRVRKRLLLLLVAGALWVASFPGLAQPLAQGGLGEATVDVTVDPSADSVQETGSFSLDVHVTGVLHCAPGMPPAPLVGTLLPDARHEGLDVVFEPEELRLDWEASGGAGEVEHRVNESLQVTVVVLSAPLDPVIMRAHALFSPADNDDQTGCTSEGYRVSQSERSGGTVTVEPGPETSREEGTQSTSFNWVPLVFAVALLGVVSLFALQRERDAPRK